MPEKESESCFAERLRVFLEGRKLGGVFCGRVLLEVHVLNGKLETVKTYRQEVVEKL